MAKRKHLLVNARYQDKTTITEISVISVCEDARKNQCAANATEFRFSGE